MHKYKLKQWFKSLFDFESLSNSKHPRARRLAVELLEIRLTPDANAMPELHELSNAVLDNNCAANSITLVDDISLLQNLTDYRANQVYFCSNNSSNFPASTFQSVNKLDAVALKAASTKGVVLIDSSLIATIPADELKGSFVVSIDGKYDVLSQITTALEGLANVPVLRIISHGDDGVLYFGNQAFDSSDLASSANQVASWGKSLTPDADILLYGCSVANTDAGKAFVQQFASITQADIAASSNLTGKGGDEVLEFQVGQVSNSLIASAIDFDSANLTLAQITVTTTADSGAGSLRQAITDANSNSANDEIIFASSLFTNGTSTITLGFAALPTIAATSGAGSLTITGPGASSLIISGNNGNTSRNFSIFNIAAGGNLSISGLTVSGAQTTDTYSKGGAIINSGTLNISSSVITGNSVSGSSSYGGGIHNDSSAVLTISNTTISSNSSGNHAAGINNDGTITITSSTISGNTAANAGGGFVNNGTLSIFNSTIFGNSATNVSGGGIFNNAILNISNTTIASNSAVSGGGIHVNGGTLNISNTIIANSTKGGDFSGNQSGTSTNNLITNGTLNGATTVTSAQLNLGPLQNNGGTTSTMALGAGSVAIGAGNATISNTSPINGLDQRGYSRITSDIGAYSFGIQVTNTSDSNTVGSGSLRAAINLANSTPGNDVIVFNLTGVNTITLGVAALPTIAATSGAGSLTITGPGASSLIISGDNSKTGRDFSVFNIASGGNLAISGVTVSGAKTSSNGAGFSNFGTLAVSNSLITGNSGGSFGGGIYSAGILSVSGSTFTGNSANYGGGLFISNPTTGTVSNSTFTGNTAANQGGGLFNNGTLTITNATVSGNTSAGAGGIHSNGTVYIANTIIANSSSGLDYYVHGITNLISPTTKYSNLVTQSGLAWATTVTSAQLNLGALQNNGGTTFTMALGAGSVAIGAGNASISNASPISGKDQRGFTRSTTAPSIGAFENNITAPTLTTISTLASATEGIPYTITYAALAGAANESDAEGDPISFRIESVTSGTLTKNGIAVFAGATILSTGESLVWIPANNGSALNAFTVKAYDGVLASATPVQVSVDVAAVTGFTTSLSGGNITITGYTGAGGAVTIPATIGGLPVVAIGTNSFKYNTSLTSVIISNSVTSIGQSAFEGCIGLTSITIGNSVISIGDYAFYGCTGLTSVTIGSGVTSIGDGAFAGCFGLTSITIGNSVTSIGQYAFYNCSGLTSITIPAGVTSIGDGAFVGCIFLTSITIGSGVTSIGGGAFGNCNSLTAITVDSSNLYYSSLNDVLFNKAQTTLIQYPVGKVGTSFVIPNSVTSIGQYAFYNCSGLTSITIPAGVTSIGDYVFQSCIFLTSITIGSGVTSIGVGAFQNCSGLKSINFLGAPPTLGTTPFASVNAAAKVYYLTGTPGWASSYGGLTTVAVSTPTVTSVNTAYATAAGGTTITITGTGLNVVNSVTVGGVAATNVTVVSSTSITVRTPAGTIGAADIVVTNLAGAATASNLFNYASTPAAPTNVVAIGMNNSASISFTPPASNGAPITSYTVTSTPGNFTATGSGSSILITGLTNGTPYTFTVKATNAIGISSASSASAAVAPFNTAPTIIVGANGVPAALAFTEDILGNLLFPGSPFADVDGTPLTVTLAIADGIIAANIGNGITLGGTGIAKTFTGSAADLNAYFGTAGNVTYQGALNNYSSRTLTTTVSDLSLSASTTTTINFASVNDAPAIGGISTSINYISTDFTTAPANATLSGSAVVSNGECVLTPAASNQYGYLLFNTLASNPTAFSAQFDYLVPDGSGADGTSFNYGVIGSPSGDESGMTNNGLVVSLIEYSTQRVEIKLNGNVIQTAYVTLTGSNYQRIVINVDSSNKLSVSVGGVAVVNNLDLGATYGNADKSSWKFGFASRCGGLNNNHSIDNLVISNTVAPVTALEQTPKVLAGSLTLSDGDNSTLASAVVIISTGLKTSEDVLGFVGNATN